MKTKKFVMVLNEDIVGLLLQAYSRWDIINDIPEENMDDLFELMDIFETYPLKKCLFKIELTYEDQKEELFNELIESIKDETFIQEYEECGNWVLEKA